MLYTHERDSQVEVSTQTSQASSFDLLGTNVPSISVRLSKVKVLDLLRKKIGFNSFANDDKLFKSSVNFINYNLQKEYPLFFLTVSGSQSNSITIKNAFHLLDEAEMHKNDNENDLSQKSLYKTLHTEISADLNRIISQLANNSSLLSEFISKTVSSKNWNGFIEAREKCAEHNNVADALDELNEDLKLYFLDGEFLSVDRYNTNIPAIYLYDCQCRIICMFSLQTDKQTVESIVKACAAISCDGEAHGQLFYSKNAEIRSENGLPVPNEISEQYVRVAYKNEIAEWVNQIRNALGPVSTAQNFLMIEVQEIVVNRFYNGFVVGHFLSNERAYNASRMAVPPPKVNYK